jgi:hypothetical protein
MFTRIEKLNRKRVLIQKPAGDGRSVFGHCANEPEVWQHFRIRFDQ